jgi:cell wall-associated NlpC family hydrolase
VTIFVLLAVFRDVGQAGGDVPFEKLRSGVVETAMSYIGSSYKRGGISSNGFDCSGFVQFVFRKHGILLARTSEGQFEQGERIDMENALPGDLVFFRIWKNKVSHVGIYLGDEKFIHAPTWGKKVSIAVMHIPYWRKTFAGASRVIGVDSLTKEKEKEDKKNEKISR